MSLNPKALRDAANGPWEAAENQCDGCQAGMPLRDGTHQCPDNPWEGMVCTKDRYVGRKEPTHIIRSSASDDGPGYVMMCGAKVFVSEDGSTFPPTIDFYDDHHGYKATCEDCRRLLFLEGWPSAWRGI